MSIVGVWATAAFLVQRRRAEEALCLSQEALERRVEERTADLQKAINSLEKEITERKQAEEALRESKERFRLITEHANDAIFYIDLNGKIHWASHQAEFLTGKPKDKFLGCTIMTLLAPESVAVAEARLDAVRRGEAVAPLIDIEFLRPDGMMIWGEANITSVQQDGKTIGRLLVVRNITERKVAEETLRESDQQLRQLLEDRERFSQNLHDNIIQTLFAIGLGLEESQRLIGGDSKTAVKNLSNAVKDLNAVMRDVRSYIAWSEPKILSGQQLKTAIEQLARTIKGAHLLQFRLQVDIMAASQLTAGEANHVLYIVREAMSNSLRHSRAKTGVVMLQMRKGRVHLQVEDDGVGFDPAVNEGTGQGLRNITARAKELGAQLGIVSEPGRGVRIALDIPKESEHASA
jgi:PAS domain S-box-containing protein